MVSVLAQTLEKVGECRPTLKLRVAMKSPIQINPGFKVLLWRRAISAPFLRQVVEWPLSFTFPITSSPLLAMQAIAKPPTKRVFVLSFVVIFLWSPIHAQYSAAIEGQVNDQHGAVLLGVEITLVNSDIGVTRKTVTDDAGRYQIAALPIGDYRIEVRADRFKTQVIESFTRSWTHGHSRFSTPDW